MPLSCQNHFVTAASYNDSSSWPLKFAGYHAQKSLLARYWNAFSFLFLFFWWGRSWNVLTHEVCWLSLVSWLSLLFFSHFCVNFSKYWYCVMLDPLKFILVFIFMVDVKGVPGANDRVLPPVTGRSWVRVAVSSHCTGEGKACHWRFSPGALCTGYALYIYGGCQLTYCFVQ